MLTVFAQVYFGFFYEIGITFFLGGIFSSFGKITFKTPFLNEPAITEQHADYESYHKLIAYCNIKIAFLGTINQDISTIDYTLFDKEIKGEYSNNLKKVIAYIKKENWNSLEAKVYTNSLYNIRCSCNYKSIYDELIKLK